VASFATTKDDEVYALTLKQCIPLRMGSSITGVKLLMFHYYNPVDKEIFWDSTKEAFSAESLNPQAIMSLIDNRGLSVSLTERMRSPGYAKALETCFPNDGVSQYLFMMRTVSWDLKGKAIATLGTVGVTYAGGKVLTFLKGLSAEAYRMTVGAFAAWSTYNATKILREAYKEGTPEQQAAAEKIVRENIDKPEQLVQQTKQMISADLMQLQKQESSGVLSPEEKMKLENKINALKTYLNELS